MSAQGLGVYIANSPEARSRSLISASMRRRVDQKYVGSM